MISVIIPTLNAAEQLPALLSKIPACEDGRMEILIVDSSSSDRTQEIAQDAGVTILTIKRSDFDHGAARSYAARKAEGHYLVFLTQDVILTSENTIETLVDVLRFDPEIAAVYGRQLPFKDASFFATCLRRFNYPPQSHIRSLSDRSQYGLKTAFLSNSFAAYRKEDLSNIGFFKERTIFGEDMHAAAKLLLNKKKIAYCATAQVYHSHNYSIAQDFRRYFDMGVFHNLEKELLAQFGHAEKQAGAYIRYEWNCLLRQKQYHLLPGLILRLMAKCAGYKTGKMHRCIPSFINSRIGLNHAWWKSRPDRP